MHAKDLKPAAVTVQEDNGRVRRAQAFCAGNGNWLASRRPDGMRHEAIMTVGRFYFRDIGVDHTSVNVSGAPVEFVEIVEIELK